MKKEIARVIDYDIERGVYDNFPWLKHRLNHISKKLVECDYVKNRSITHREIETLLENEYIEKHEIKNLTK